LAGIGARILIVGIAVVTRLILRASLADVRPYNAIAASRRDTSIETGIAVVQIAVIALLPRINHAVATGNRHLTISRTSGGFHAPSVVAGFMAFPNSPISATRLGTTI
jgi:hypothetical protein